ncbi:TetR family transcriptional regulator [Tamaricihabitans halophyticus]|uniref:TetR family transcriptional regulator n=1 Tax=Tamaricihabitans halophyticus TaxID=1262583 RepID=A0A4R2PYA0_9PSEU|nr:QsdR family transcriptional regulator [Tamaricihabitans halophyticus]TCP41223.1 TetR family transcriptional regulator [Tamaricihabitans halophyticus]
MQDLAANVGISRATLFRWVGSRDELLTEVLWSLAEPTLRDAVASAQGERGARVAAALGSFAEALHAADYFRTFLRREPERALRVLTTRAGSLQGRMTAAMQDLLVANLDADALPLDLPDMAYLLVRVAESYIYADIIIGAEPDPTKVYQAVATLLRD